MPQPVRAARPRWVLGTVAVVALLVGGVALAGGFADVPRQRLPVYDVGDTFDNGVYRITVRSIEVVDRDPLTGYDLDEPVIAAEVDLLLRGDGASRNALKWLQPLDVQTRSTDDRLRTARDGAISPPVQPGVPVRTIFTWEPEAGGPRPGDAVRLGVYERYEAQDVPLEGVLTTPVLVGIFEAAP